MTYTAPLQDIRHTLKVIANYDAIQALPGNDEFSPDLLDAVLEEAGKLARDTLAPLHRVGDTVGARIVDGRVVMPEGWQAAYDVVAEGGWIGLSENPDYGGQGMPYVAAAAVSEMWNGANVGFALGNALTQGAIHAIDLNGSGAQKSMYLPKMMEGVWSGAMDLTEPQAGSNLAAIRTMATPDGDIYRVTGQKIFISYGEHELTENIVHLVLARTPDAPAGVKGLSLFIVPKILVNEDGSLGERNDVNCVSLEHKMGLHASPTAVMNFGEGDGAVGYLLGELGRGLEYMFVMMNAARFEMGVQGPSYQQALSYAQERKQGIALGHTEEGTIIDHPDVRRMLMSMKARTEAMRCIAYLAAAAGDRSHGLEDEDARATAKADYEFLIPIVKGWLTETCQQVTYDGLQVHGGWGFIEETGAAQYVRDARITTLYEGTTGIHAADLTFRKTAKDKASTASRLLSGFKDQTPKSPILAAAHATLMDGVVATEEFLDWLVAGAGKEAANAASASDTYLRAMGTMLGAGLLIRSAVAALVADPESGFAQNKSATAAYFAAAFVPQATASLNTIKALAPAIPAFSSDWF